MTLSLTSPLHSGIFDRWAEVYDLAANPLLMLEEQTLPPLLPSVAGMYVLDVGCGTGRWLKRLQALQPASLTGTDCSSAMLQRARRKLASTCVLIQNDSSTLPVFDSSQDFILSSFVLSYLRDLPGFASECARVLRPGGHLLLSDMHPETAKERGWTRGFESGSEKTHIAAQCYPLTEIVTIFRRNGLIFDQLVEPSFTTEQQTVFEEAGRLSDFASFAGERAIYLLKLRKDPKSRSSAASQQNQNSVSRVVSPKAKTKANAYGSSDEHTQRASTLILANTSWSTGSTAWCTAPLRIEDGLIATQRSDCMGTTSSSIDLSGYALLPGLINAHDHLEFALFPNLGRAADRKPYRSSAEWAHEIHEVHADTIGRYSRVPRETNLWWGALRNLLCGVTTVCHHNRMYPELWHTNFPVRIVSEFGWGHSLAFDPNLIDRFLATPADQPFILHAGEGRDKQSRGELRQLDRMHLLERRTVVVHGLAFTQSDVALLNRRGASHILCPTSNRFLFGCVPSGSFIRLIERAALGSDSPLTAAGDLLDEISCLRAEQHVDAATLYSLVTQNPATMLRLSHGEGHIVDNGRADLIAVRKTNADPAETLAALTFDQVELVMLSGRVQVASHSIYKRLSNDLRDGLEALDIAGQERWVRAPLHALFPSAEKVLGQGNLRLGGKQVRHLSPL